MSDGIARFKDFTAGEEPISFKVGDQVYVARDDILLQHLGRLSEVSEGLGEGGDKTVNRMLAIFEKLLEAESFERFKGAVTGESGSVIGIIRIQKIVPWLLEQYGLRPTEASSGSSSTLSESGANSTDGALGAVSIS